MTPEQQARQQIDAQLVACGWVIQGYAKFNPAAAHGITLREVPFSQRGGLGRAAQLFGDQLNPLLEELNEAFAA